MIKFPAVGNDQIMYVFDKSKETYHWNNDGLHWYCQKYDTHGDGTTQHSPCYMVPCSETLPYLRGLLKHFHDNPSDAGGASWLFTPRYKDEDFEFLLKVVHSEERPRLYSLRHHKVIKPDSRIKAGDRKYYHDVPEYADGTYTAIFRMLLIEDSWYAPLQKLVLYRAIQNHSSNAWASYEFQSQFTGDPNSDDFWHVRTTLGHLQNLLGAYETLENVKCYVERNC